MQKILSAAEMREVDRLTTERYGIPPFLLMENAAHAAACVIAEKLGGQVSGKSFLIMCGKGNNGGDGAALARILWQRGADVEVCYFGRVEEAKPDARTNLEILQKLSEQRFVDLTKADISFEQFISIEEWREYVSANFHHDDPDVLVDALFGTGLTRALEDEYREVVSYIKAFNIEDFEQPTLVVSLDLPSGLDADCAECIGDNVQSHLTIAFTAPKPANVLPPASNCNGELVTVDIGSPCELVEASPSQLFIADDRDVYRWLEQTKFSSASYKNKRGHALLIAGSNNYAGAAVLSGNAAIRSGVGLVTIATPESMQTAIASRVLSEVMTRGVAETKNGAVAEKAFAEIDDFIEGKIDAVAIGSGLASTDASTKKLVRKIVESRRTPVVIDADGLNLLAPFKLKGSPELPLILTPHAGEFLKLTGAKDKEAALKDRVKAARDFAQKHEVIIVLKGERNLIAAPDGRVVINPTGNSGLGKAGNGDVLAGIITGFVAQAVQMKIDIFESVIAAVYLAALAGDIAEKKVGKRAMLASHVSESLTDAFREFEE
ncbi:MAG: NAD(P)H-hydrate dehydratase [Acidobacteriota bacterium]|nr:NAD(P)H-hydrate dehydratase [Acidobacteriota bacterium]